MLKAPPLAVMEVELVIPLPPVAAMFCNNASLGDGWMLTATFRIRPFFRELALRDYGRFSLLEVSAFLRTSIISGVWLLGFFGSVSVFMIFKFLSFSDASKLGVLLSWWAWLALWLRLLGAMYGPSLLGTDLGTCY